MTKEEMKTLAGQLRKPEGSLGLEVAEEMYKINRSIIQSTVEQLDFNKNDVVLEIGHGNGLHIDFLLQGKKKLIYHGLELSELMHEEALKINQHHITAQRAFFNHYNGKKFPYSDLSFDKIFTINTLYFWEDPDQFLAEVRRILKDNGLFSVTFASEATLSKLPVTQYGFTSYSRNTFETLMTTNHLAVKNIIRKNENVITHDGKNEERDFFIALIQKSE